MHNHYVSRKSWNFWKEAIFLLSRKISLFRDFLFSFKRPFKKTSKRLDLARAMREAGASDPSANGKFLLSKRGDHFRRPDMRPFLNVFFVGLVIGLTMPPTGSLSVAMAAEEDQLAAKKEQKSSVMEDAKPAAKTEKPAVATQMLKAEPPKEEMASKSMTGEVAGVGPMFIAVMYDQDQRSAYEMAFNLDEKAKIVGKKNLNEIKAGDTVTVSYDERFQRDEKGDIRINGRKVTSIVFVREGKRLIEESPAAEETQDGSEAEAQEGT